MRISAREYERLPERLQAMFYHVDGSDEVMAAFPESESGRASGYDWDESNNDNAVHVTKNIKSGVHFGDSGSAARFFFSAKAGSEDRFGSRHPTVKPVELMKWLVALVCPPGGTVLDCFAGSGTAAVAALATGRNAILIEQSADYVADIRERLAFYEGEGRHSLASKARRRAPEALGGLFAGASE